MEGGRRLGLEEGRGGGGGRGYEDGEEGVVERRGRGGEGRGEEGRGGEDTRGKGKGGRV